MRTPLGAIKSGCKGLARSFDRQAQPAAGRPSKDPATADKKKKRKRARRQPGGNGRCGNEDVARRVHGMERYRQGDTEVKC